MPGRRKRSMKQKAGSPRPSLHLRRLTRRELPQYVLQQAAVAGEARPVARYRRAALPNARRAAAGRASARSDAYAAFLDASCRSTYCSRPPWRKYSTSFGVSSSTSASNSTWLPPALVAVTLTRFDAPS